MIRSLLHRAVFGAALAASVAVPALATSQASAQEICFPTPVFVPGGFANSPKWAPGMPNAGLVINSVNEPRWGAFDPQRFFNDLAGESSQSGNFRIIREGQYVYVSLQATNDKTKTALDFVSIGLFNETKRRGYVVQIPLNVGTGDPAPASGVEHYLWDATGSAWSLVQPGLPTDNVIVPASVGSFTRLPVVDGGADWAIQFAIDTTKLQLDNDTSPFKIYLIARTNIESAGNRQPVLSVPRRDAGAIPSIGTSLVATDRTKWVQTSLGAPCANGVEFYSDLNIGVTRNGADPSNEINDAAGAVNKFSARPRWNSVNPADYDLGEIKARFRMADWGAQVDGVDPFVEIPTLGAVDHNQTTGFFEKDCPPNSGGRVCGDGTTGVKTTSKFQCMIVELSSSAGVPIKTPIQYRNMRFETLSSRTLDAVINAKGLKKKTGRAGQQDVLVDVVTRNMPQPGNLPLFLDSTLLNYLKLFAIGVINAINPFGVSIKADQQMKMAWPTYEVHSYFDTGRTHTYKGVSYREYSPMISYGYYFSHSGIFYGYAHTLSGPTVDRLVNTAETFSVRVEEEKTAAVRTSVRTEDLPAFVTGLLGTVEDIACRVFPICAR